MKSLKYYFYSFLFLALIFIFNNANAQEELVHLGSNRVIKDYILVNSLSYNKVQQNDTIDLPLIDDFSGTDVYPDPQKWTDKNVFINNNFPRNPITINVATFDGLDPYGNAYDSLGGSSQGSADTLTSRPLYLFTKPNSVGGGQYTLSDSITMSFYYERKGWGDATENNDSLVLEYFNPATSQWSKQWYAMGTVTAGNDTTFTRVELRLKNAAFLVDGFRFRFRNYGGLTGSQDNWHIDYVRFFKALNFNTNQMDTSLVDIAFTQKGKSILEGFTSIPWDHFKSLSTSAQQTLIKDSLTLNYRVNDIQNEDVGFNNRIYDFAGSYVAGFGAPNGNILTNRPKNTNLTYSLPVDSIFPISPSLSGDSTAFSFKSYFSNSSAFVGIKTNDTITYNQEFYNYYSYDDGTAEAGYDLVNSPNGKLAMQFDILKPDTLRAIRIMFVQQLVNVSSKLFTIKVWSSLSPETIIYQEYNQKPVYLDTINGFITYVLDQIVPVSGTIYIGFQQIAPDGLHLGFDRNTNSNSKMFYNIGGSWLPVGVATGSFMMRPVMGDSTLFVGVQENKNESSDFIVFPNPTNNKLNLKFSHPENVNLIELLNIQGEVLYHEFLSNSINIESFADGMYLIKITAKDGTVLTKKFVKRNN